MVLIEHYNMVMARVGLYFNSNLQIHTKFTLKYFFPAMVTREHLGQLFTVCFSILLNFMCQCTSFPEMCTSVGRNPLQS